MTGITSHCNIYGFLGLVFLLTSIGMIFFTSPKLIKNLEKTLDDQQKKSYKAIVRERRSIYMMGFAVALLFTLLYTYIGPKEGLFYGSITVFILVHYLFYMIHPKSRFIIEILDKKEQREAWLKVYRKMSLAYHHAFLLSIIGTGLFLKVSC